MIGIEKEIYSEFYKLIEKYCDYQNTFECWQEIITAHKKLLILFENHPMAISMYHLNIAQIEYRIGGYTIQAMKSSDWDVLRPKVNEYRKSNGKNILSSWTEKSKSVYNEF